MTSVTAQGVPEPLGVLEEVRSVLEDRHGVLSPLNVIDEPRVHLDECEDGVPEILLFDLDLPNGFVGGSLIAPDN